MTKISIIGFGNLGQALEKVLSNKKPKPLIRAWDVINTGHPCQTKDLIKATQDANFIFFAIPSEHIQDCLSKLPTLPSKTTLITCTKGLDKTTGLLPIQLLRKKFPKNPVAVLSGPMLADELRQLLPTKATIASLKSNSLKPITKLFASTCLTLETSTDEIGISFLGVLKNIYAIGLGLVDGLKLGHNLKACVALQAIIEMDQIIQQLKGKPNSIWQTAGMADFLTTGFSPNSRNYNYGYMTAIGRNPTGSSAEGVKNLTTVWKLLKNPTQFPLLHKIKKIIINRQSPNLISKLN